MMTQDGTRSGEEVRPGLVRHEERMAPESSACGSTGSEMAGAAQEECSNVSYIDIESRLIYPAKRRFLGQFKVLLLFRLPAS